MHKIFEKGRSMIEMLGVLAIIGVLSVGGIAGYSKAMEKFKINKIVAEYSSILLGLIEYKDNILGYNSNNQVVLTDVMIATGLVSKDWKKFSNIGFYDPFGNDVYFYSMKFDYGKGISMDIYIGGEKVIAGKKASPNFSVNLCVELFNNFAHPLHSEIFRATVASYEKGWYDVEFFGDKYCGIKDRKCLKDAKLTDFKTACQSCSVNRSKCAFGIRF